MQFKVCTGSLCQQVEATGYTEAVRSLLKEWKQGVHLGSVVECSIDGQEPRFFDTESELNKLSIRFKVDMEQRLTIISG
jgi:hypothetical protein